MRLSPSACATDLGPHAATYTTRVDGHPVAVVNTRALTDPALRAEAANALRQLGLDAHHILKALAVTHGRNGSVHDR